MPELAAVEMLVRQAEAWRERAALETAGPVVPQALRALLADSRRLEVQPLEVGDIEATLRGLGEPHACA